MTTSAVGAVGEMREALDRLAAAGLATGSKPHGFTVDGLRTLSDLAVLAMMTGSQGDKVDQALSQTARALLNLVGALSAEVAGQPSKDVAPLVREAEKALRQASKHAKAF